MIMWIVGQLREAVLFFIFFIFYFLRETYREFTKMLDIAFRCLVYASNYAVSIDLHNYLDLQWSHLHNYLREKIRGVASATASHFRLTLFTILCSSIFPRVCVNTLAYFHRKYHGSWPRRCENRRAKGRRVASRRVASRDPHRKNEVNPTFVNKDPAHSRRGGITAVVV